MSGLPGLAALTVLQAALDRLRELRAWMDEQPLWASAALMAAAAVLLLLLLWLLPIAWSRRREALRQQRDRNLFE